MPSNAPDSLTNDQVYAVTAYVLSDAKIVPADTTLEPENLAKLKMPNLDGLIADRRPERFPAPTALRINQRTSLRKRGKWRRRLLAVRPPRLWATQGNSRRCDVLVFAS